MLYEVITGSGYPDGLSGNDTLLESRILAVADVIEAMTSHRPYRPALSLDETLLHLKQGRGSIYDRHVCDALSYNFV